MKSGKTWGNCTEHKLMQPHQSTPRLGRSESVKEMGFCPVSTGLPLPFPNLQSKVSVILARGPHSFYHLELSPHGDMCGTSSESLPAKAAWILFSSVPLQTPGAQDTSQRPWDASPAIVLSPDTRDYFSESVSKNLGDCRHNCCIQRIVIDQ